jgi:hypothetical protein
VAYPLYVSPTSSNPLVRASISHQLRVAAEAELLKHTSIIDTDDLYSEADKAFEALSILLVKTLGFLGIISQRYLMQVYLLTRNYYLMTNWDGKKRSFAGHYEGERTLYNIEIDCL